MVGTIFSRLLYAGRMSPSIGLVSTIGMLVNRNCHRCYIRFFGGLLDTILREVTEFVNVYPALICYVLKRLGDKIKNPYGSAYNTSCSILS